MELFDQEVWDNKVKDEDKEALDDYLLELEANGRAVKTRYQYSADIKGFLFTWRISFLLPHDS